MALRRFTEHTPSFDHIYQLAPDSAPVRNARALYVARVRYPTSTVQLLKSGEHSRKIGRKVMKGRWRGMPIFTLTIEERATCPRDCQHWLSCYGNKMNWSVRWKHGPMLEAALPIEIERLAWLHPDGFVIRLHVLGDFYSVEYVRMWERLLDQLPALRCFGYTARSPYDDPIGTEIDRLSSTRWDRFAIRFSNAWRDDRSAATLWRRGRVPPKIGIVCPAQTGTSDCCATCALCWQTRKNIFFEAH